jgi:hypothetical protein
MKFATALLFAAVVSAATDDDTTKKDADAKTGAKKGEACDASATDKGCADGLRCHLGGTVAAAKSDTTAVVPKTCTEQGLGASGWVVSGTTTVAACKFAAKKDALDFVPDDAAKPTCTAG